MDPEASPPSCSEAAGAVLQECAQKIREARQREAGVLLMYGAHLLRNGAALILERMMARGWLTHLATNGAGSIHDWEFAYGGRSTESVRENVASGTFGAWDETGRYLHLALLAGGLQGDGYGQALGRLIQEDGVVLPTLEWLQESLKAEPQHPAAPARADLLQAMLVHQLSAGHHALEHRWKHASIVGQAYCHGIPCTVHPGIGYDIISNHPLFNGAVIGRAAGVDFRRFGGAVEQLDGGVVLSIGSAIMAPQVFEKSLSCVNNLRIQNHRPIVHDHYLCVVDLPDGGQWDWSKSEPPKDQPAYYLRYCKSFSRMGGTMRYVSCHNVTFVHRLYHCLSGV